MENPPVLTTPHAIRDHLDLIIGPEDRRRRGVWFVFCDHHAEPMVHAAIDDVPAETAESECEAAISPFATVFSEADPGGGMLLAIARPGPAQIGENDRRWFRAVHAICRRVGIGVLGVYLATPRDTVPIHLDDALAALWRPHPDDAFR
jgi:hypothetical protein